MLKYLHECTAMQIIETSTHLYYRGGLAMTVPIRETITIPSSELADVCQQRYIHPEHALAVRQHLLPTDAARDAATIFAVLADPTRLQVLYALLSAPDGELCVCDLAAGLGRDDTTISHQLRVLRNQHLVTMRKVGRVVYYRLVD